MFDGHYGGYAAAVSAQTLNHDVLRRYNDLTQRLSESDEFNGLSAQEKADALFVESLRISCSELDENIRGQHSSGCTMNCLFVMPSQEYDGTRVVCANIGDSRTILFTAVTDGRGHFNEFGLSSSEHSESTMTMSRTDSDASNVSKSRKIKIFPCSEDHRLTLNHERTRIEERLRPDHRALPSDLVLCTLMTTPSPDSTEPEDSSLGFLYLGYPPQDVLDMAASFAKSIANECESVIRPKLYSLTSDPVIVSDPKLSPVVSAEQSFPEDVIPKVLHSESFIARRTNSRGEKVGPVAVMGRYGLSITMTRSIGDRYGPRCVSADPEVSAVNIPDDSYARFVTASDGVWDTLTNRQVRKLVKRIRDPKDAARKVAEYASRRRLAEGRYADDISVMIVDVNPHNYPKEWRRRPSVHSCAIQ